MDDFNGIVKSIKKLEIQGASAIAKKGLMAFAKYVGKGKNYEKDIEYAKSELFSARSTEPMLFNGINCIIKNAKSKKDFIPLAKKLIAQKEASEEIISNAGAELVKNGMTVFTHCHSSSVVNVLKKAKKQGKKFRVVCFETRPKFQGRKTAVNLANAGIDVTLTVDSAMTEAFEEFHPNIAFVGCDAITDDFLINKIGTDTLANIAKKHNVPFYVCTETFKYTNKLKIEHRNPDEIWANAPKNFRIWNPAFDTTSRKLIAGFITEKGIMKKINESAW